VFDAESMKELIHSIETTINKTRGKSANA